MSWYSSRAARVILLDRLDLLAGNLAQGCVPHRLASASATDIVDLYPASISVKPRMSVSMNLRRTQSRTLGLAPSEWVVHLTTSALNSPHASTQRELKRQKERCLFLDRVME